MCTVRINDTSSASYPDLTGLSLDGLREVWQTHSDPSFAQQAHVRMCDQICAPPSWSSIEDGFVGIRAGVATYALF
jgi:hypothetical protein